MYNHPAFERLPKRLTISFPLWVVYATKGEYSPYFDIDKLMRENVERGFNCIRIDGAPGLIHDINGNLRKPFYMTNIFDGNFEKIPRQQNILGDGGEVDLLDRLIKTFESAKRHGIYIILSQWYFLHTFWFHKKGDPLCDEMFAIPVKERFPAFAKFWHYILLQLEERGLDDQIAFVELFNEVSHCPYFCGERGCCGSTDKVSEEEVAFFKKQHEDALSFLQKQHPQLLFAYDTGNPYAKGHMPENAQVYNYHSYHLMGIYSSVLNEHPEWAMNKITADDVRKTREGRRPINDSWYDRVARYNDLNMTYLKDFEEALAKKFRENRDDFVNKARAHMKASFELAGKNRPVVLGEGVSYICCKELLWEEKSEDYWNFVKQMAGEYKDAGMWGMVVRTCCAPEDPSWYMCADKYLQINSMFLK